MQRCRSGTRAGDSNELHDRLCNAIAYSYAHMNMMLVRMGFVYCLIKMQQSNDNESKGEDKREKQKAKKAKKKGKKKSKNETTKTTKGTVVLTSCHRVAPPAAVAQASNAQLDVSSQG
jgi:hypothetical protein